MISDIKILVADDHPLLLSGLAEALRNFNYEVVATCENGAKALDQIIDLQPTIAILDIEMPYLSGIEVIRKCKEKGLDTKFIILTSHKENSLILETKSLGISGYILKEEPFSEVQRGIQEVHRGNTYFSKTFDAIYNTKIAPELERIKYLTPSERTIVRLIAKGNTSKNIAEMLGLSVRTIDNHRANIINKLELPSQTDALTIWAKEHSRMLETL